MRMFAIIIISALMLFLSVPIYGQDNVVDDRTCLLYENGFESLAVHFGTYKPNVFEVFYQGHQDYSFYLLPIEPNSIISVVGNKNTSELFFLKTDKLPAGAGPLDVVKDCKKHFYTFKATELTIEAPADARYMYLTRQIAGADRLPTELVINGHNIIHPESHRALFLANNGITDKELPEYIDAIAPNMCDDFKGIAFFQAPVMVVCDDENSTIVMGAEAKTEDGKCPFYVCSISTDGGKSFSASVKYMTDGKGNYLMDKEGKKKPVPMTELLYDRELNRIISLTASYCYASDDMGDTWYLLSDFSKQVEVPEGFTSRSYSPTAGIQLTNGILAAPMRFLKRSKTENKILAEVNFVLYSKDHGKTWTRTPYTPVESVTDEVTIVEYAKNQIMLNARGGSEFWMDDTMSGRRVFIPQKKSKNNINKWAVTGWTTEKKSDGVLFDPICNAAILKTKIKRRNVALFCNPLTEGDFWPRRNLVLQMSKDFKHWQPVCLLTAYGEKNQGYCALGTNGEEYYFAYEQYRGNIKFANITDIVKTIK